MANKEVDIYRSGLIHCSVCAPKEMPAAEVERAVNLQSPTGISSQWKVSDDPNFASGAPNPSPCDRDPERLHYLMVC